MRWQFLAFAKQVLLSNFASHKHKQAFLSEKCLGNIRTNAKQIPDLEVSNQAFHPPMKRISPKGILGRTLMVTMAGSMAMAVVSIPKASAQIPILPFLESPNISSDADSRIVSGGIYLDGYEVFQIAATRSFFPERSRSVQQYLNLIHQNYLRSSDAEIKPEILEQEKEIVIRINGQYLMTVTDDDARLRRTDKFLSATQITEQLKVSLEQSRRERTSDVLINQAQLAGAIGLLTLALSGGVYYFQRRSKQNYSTHPILPISDDAQQLTTQLNQQQDRDIQEVKKRLFQLTQASIWGSSIVFVLGLFPHTRLFQVGILSIAQIPLRLGIVILGVYVAIRFTYALIDRFTSTLISTGVIINSEANKRMQLRVSTFSGVSKSITTGILLTVGLLLSLVSLGIDIVPLLAGAGLIGVALSLASQSLIKDAINGFLVIVEDQYALGDVIVVGEVGGLVENLNLRITQLRDAEGRLITIPNSEIKVVANLSSRWSRADLTIPVAYQNNIDDVLQLLKQVASDMNQDPHWKRLIVAPPEVLGIDNFGDRGLMIRVWIKTLPLKQWDVGREFRRRLKVTFDQAGFTIPVPQQGIWLNEGQLLYPSEVNGKSENNL